MEDSRGNERQVKDRRSSDKNFNHKWIGTQGSLFFLRSLKDFPSLSMQFPEKGRMREGEKRRWRERENDTKAPRNDAMKGEIPVGLILDVSVCFPVSPNPFLLLLRILLQTELNNSEEKKIRSMTDQSSCTQDVDMSTLVFRTCSEFLYEECFFHRDS